MRREIRENTKVSSHSFIHSFIAFIYLIHSIIDSFINLSHSLIHSFIYHSFTHSFIHSFNQSINQSVIQSFLHLYIHSFIGSELTQTWRVEIQKFIFCPAGWWYDDMILYIIIIISIYYLSVIIYREECFHWRFSPDDKTLTLTLSHRPRFSLLFNLMLVSDAVPLNSLSLCRTTACSTLTRPSTPTSPVWRKRRSLRSPSLAPRHLLLTTPPRFQTTPPRLQSPPLGW